MVALVSRRKEKKMIDREKVIKSLERCLICDISVVATPEAQKAYLECEYTVGRYCGRKNVLRDALYLLKEQDERIKTLEHQLETITKWRANAGAFD